MMPTKGMKEDKVKAAFEYADLFLRESNSFEDEPAVVNESKNKSGLSWLRGKSE